MNDVDKLLDELRINPIPTLGKKSLTRLVDFVFGYIFRTNDTEGIFLSFLPEFQDFVVDYYNFGESHNWTDIIQFDCHQDEERSFNKFYELMDLYREKFATENCEQ